VNALSDNSDFNRFIANVNKDFRYGEAHKDKYDREQSEGELLEQYQKFFNDKK